MAWSKGDCTKLTGDSVSFVGAALGCWAPHKSKCAPIDSSLAALWEVQKLAREGHLVQQGGLQALAMSRS